MVKSENKKLEIAKLKIEKGKLKKILLVHFKTVGTRKRQLVSLAVKK